jgi:hypothetical protein
LGKSSEIIGEVYGIMGEVSEKNGKKNGRSRVPDNWEKFTKL